MNENKKIECPICGTADLAVERRLNGDAGCLKCDWFGPYAECFKKTPSKLRDSAGSGFDLDLAVMESIRMSPAFQQFTIPDGKNPATWAMELTHAQRLGYDMARWQHQQSQLAYAALMKDAEMLVEALRFVRAEARRRAKDTLSDYYGDFYNKSDEALTAFREKYGKGDVSGL